MPSCWMAVPMRKFSLNYPPPVHVPAAPSAEEAGWGPGAGRCRQPGHTRSPKGHLLLVSLRRAAHSIVWGREALAQEI